MTYLTRTHLQIKFQMHRSILLGALVSVINFVEGPENLIKL